MGRTAIANRQRIEELKTEYGLSEKAARFVDVDLREPQLTTSEKARVAGYTENTRMADGGKRLRTARIIKAKKSELAKMAKLEAEVQMYQADPRQYITKALVNGVNDQQMTATQVKSAELLGKMDGLFIERMEIDIGVQARGRLFGNVLHSAKVSEETEDDN